MKSRPKLKINGKTVSTHRHVWEEANGPIPEGWEVHHVDGDRFNNELSNLVAMSPEDHRAHHAHAAQKHPKEKACVVCQKPYEPPPKHRGRSQVCSPICRSRLASMDRTKNNPMRKITPEMSSRIRERLADGERGVDLANEYGVSKATISRHKNLLVKAMIEAAVGGTEGSAS